MDSRFLFIGAKVNQFLPQFTISYHFLFKTFGLTGYCGCVLIYFFESTQESVSKQSEKWKIFYINFMFDSNAKRTKAKH